MVQAVRSHKGVSISINMVVVTVIALIVLAICAYLVISKGGRFNQGTELCEPPSGKCTIDICGQGEAEEFPLANHAATCPKSIGGETQQCCIKL